MRKPIGIMKKNVLCGKTFQHVKRIIDTLLIKAAKIVTILTDVIRGNITKYNYKVETEAYCKVLSA